MGKNSSKKPKTKPEKQIAESAAEDNSSLEIKASVDEHTVFLRVKEAYEEAARKREHYKKYGPLAVLISGVLFLALMFTLDDKIIFLILCGVVSFICMTIPHAICARLKVEQVFKFYWTIVAGLAAMSLIMVWAGL